MLTIGVRYFDGIDKHAMLMEEVGEVKVDYVWR
jgi:hypothetical protein